MRGDELIARRRVLLIHLYNEGAEGPDCAMRYDRLGFLLRLDDAEFGEVFDNAEDAGLVRASGITSSFQGRVFATSRFWLTDRGIEEASGLVSQ